MEAVPRHQIVLLDDDYAVSNCNDDKTICLPICNMSDLRFQLVTNFSDLDGRVFLIATPCDVCGDITASDLFAELFSGSRLPIGFAVSSVNDNNFSITPLSGSFGSVAIGQQIFITTDNYVPDTYSGFHTVEDNSFGGLLDLASPGEIPISGDCAIGQVIQGGGILATSSTQIANGTEFSGVNHLWDFSGVISDAIPYNEGDCFRLCIYKITMTIPAGCATPVFSEGQCLGVTNCFRYMPNSCYSMKIKYQFNENSMGFHGTTPTLSVRLPMYLSRPQYPGEEKGYQKSDGTFLKLSERIDKEWQLKTDWLPDALHQRIRVALSADFIQIWNENENLALEGIYRDSEYRIEWHEEVDYPVAKATTTVKKRTLVASVNSNCV